MTIAVIQAKDEGKYKRRVIVGGKKGSFQTRFLGWTPEWMMMLFTEI